MSQPTVTDTLNNLLAAEYASILPRLRESDPFVSLDAADDREAAYSLVRDAERHEGALADLIMGLRGAPVPPSYDIDTTSYHYVTLEYLIPQILQSVRSLVEAYSNAGSTRHKEADALIARHLADYQKHVAPLERMHANLVAQG